jgi:hypothetical protein
MSPKTPRKPSVATARDTDTTTQLAGRPVDPIAPYSPWGPDFITADLANPFQTSSPRPGAERPQSATVEITITPRNVADQPVDSSIEKYWLSEDLLHNMAAADETGVRYIVGRKFVDVEYDGTLHTANVDQTPVGGAYQLRLLTELKASGPLVYKNPHAPTWRLAESTRLTQKRPASGTADAPLAQRPRSATAIEYVDAGAYVETVRSPDAQGYYELRPRSLLPTRPSDMLFAFRDVYGRWLKVDPPSGGFGAQPANLPHWTDKEIFDLYRIHGQDIERFRAQAQASGLPPKWVEPIAAANPFKSLLNDRLRWLYPSFSATQRETWLQSYNLLPSQITRLQLHLHSEPTVPQWAESHKQMAQDLSNSRHLEQFALDTARELALKRGAKHAWYDPERCMTAAVREALLGKLGYRRNKNKLLYRTDVPALFRGDDRAPFEMANDDTMLPRMDHKPGATTDDRPMSATFSLKEAMMYGKEPDPEYLLYNSQTHKYPGKPPNDDASDSSATESSDASDSSDDDGAVAWTRERKYTAARTRQTDMFIYLLDTRGIEVVPREENVRFNSDAEKKPAWFPEDDYEGLISATPNGLEASRVWMLNSTLTKAANIKDIARLADSRAETLEAVSHAGHSTQHQYDELIDKAEALGNEIVRLSGRKNEYGDDIVWP